MMRPWPAGDLRGGRPVRIYGLPVTRVSVQSDAEKRTETWSSTMCRTALPNQNERKPETLSAEAAESEHKRSTVRIVYILCKKRA